MTQNLQHFGNVGYTSPYVQTVFVALEEKGLDYDLHFLDLDAGEHRAERYAADSITNRVPALRHGDFWIAESSAICEYLEEVFAPPDHVRLYPSDPQARARVRMVQALTRSDFTPIREERSTGTLFAGEEARPLSKAAQASAARLIRIAGSLVEGRRYLTDEFTLADVDLSMMLQRLVGNDDPVPAPIAEYANFVWERPSIQKWLLQTEYGKRPRAHVT